LDRGLNLALRPRRDQPSHILEDVAAAALRPDVENDHRPGPFF
jgi:hypothetical protein